jgi:hemerythrin-like domain-containing protein
MSTRDLIRELEQLGEQLGDMQRRLLDDLKSYADASEAYLGSIERHIERATLANACIVAEAAWILHENEVIALPGGAAVLTRSAAVAGGYRGRPQ